MATKKTIRMPKEFRDKVKREREQGRMVYVTGAGDVGFVKMQRGAKKGHRSCKK
jgi:hypothetical protein